MSGNGGKQPLISIVCVTFNAEQSLPSLIKSVATHRPDAVEFVVIDGDSEDKTVEILKANEAVVDFWLSEPDKGIYDAMNKAVDHVKGKWVIFMGADDELADEFGQIPPLLTDESTLYYGDVIFYGKEFRKIYDDYYLTKLNICHQAIFYPISVFNKYRYDLKYKVYADYHLNLQCWNDAQFKFEHLPYMVASFPEGGFSSYTKDEVFEAERDVLFKKYLKRSSYYRYLNRTLGFWGMLKRFLQNN